jgi:molecular chaperone GrpE
VGKKFDPNVHEAVYQEESEKEEPGTVIGEFQKGYVMDGRLLRPSMVSVAKKPERE